MPETVGVRELKNQASRIIRTVREDFIEYVVTLRGEPVAVLRPLTDKDTEHLRQAEQQRSLASMKRLSAKVGAAWDSPKSGVELVTEQRR